MTEEQSHTEGVWKDKYTTLIKEMDAREEEVKSYEDLIHRCVTKLAILVQDFEPELDEKLEKLRVLLDGTVDLSELKTQVDDLSEAFRRAEQANQHRLSDFKNGLGACLDLLGYMSLSREMSNTLKALRKSTNRLDSSKDCTALLQEFMVLVGEVVKLIHEKKLALFPPHSAMSKVKSLLSGTSAAEVEDFLLPDNMQEQLAKLLDSLGVHGDLAEKVTVLHQEVDRGLTIRALPVFLRDLVTVVISVARADEEKVETFCSYFKDNVADSKTYFGALQGALTSQTGGSKELRDSIHIQFEKITNEVYEKTDKNILPLLDKRLKHMVSTVNIFQEKTEKDLQDASSHINDLKKQLEDSEEQVNSLNQHIAEKRYGMQKDV